MCIGQADLSIARGQVNGSFSANDGASRFGAGLALGSATGLFGSTGIGVTSYDDIEGSTLGVGTGVGFDMLGAASPISLCALAGVGFGFGPNDIEGSGVDFSSRDFSAGIGIGGTIVQTTSIALIPAVQASVVHERITFSDDIDSISESETYGALTLGMSLLARERVNFTPFVSVPLGLDGAEPSYGLRLSIVLSR